MPVPTFCPPAQLHLDTEGLHEDAWRVWGQGIPVGGTHGAAEPCPSVHQSVPWCVQGFTSRKFQETPREAHGGSGLGAARALSQQMCLQGRRAGRKNTNLSFKDICLFTIKTISQRQPDRAIFMRRRRRLEGCCQLLLTRKGSGDCILSQDQGEGKKIRAERFTSL